MLVMSGSPNLSPINSPPLLRRVGYLASTWQTRVHELIFEVLKWNGIDAGISIVLAHEG